MKKFKIFIPTVLALMTISTMPVSANSISTLPVPASEESTIMPLAEEVEWYYRYNDEGVLQKRLWSITYGYWLTDWIDC